MCLENIENKKTNKPQKLGKELSQNLMDILDMWETPNLDSYSVLPNKIAYDLIEEWYWDYVINNIDKFNKTSQLFNRIIKYCNATEINEKGLIDLFSWLNRKNLETMLRRNKGLIRYYDMQHDEGWKKFWVDEITRKRYLLCEDKFDNYNNEKTATEDKNFLNTLFKRSYNYYFSQDNETINQLREKYIRNGYSTSE